MLLWQLAPTSMYSELFSHSPELAHSSHLGCRYNTCWQPDAISQGTAMLQQSPFLLTTCRWAPWQPSSYHQAQAQQ